MSPALRAIHRLGTCEAPTTRPGVRVLWGPNAAGHGASGGIVVRTVRYELAMGDRPWLLLSPSRRGEASLRVGLLVTIGPMNWPRPAG